MNDAYRQAWKGTPPTRTTVVTRSADAGRARRDLGRRGAVRRRSPRRPPVVVDGVAESVLVRDPDRRHAVPLRPGRAQRQGQHAWCSGDVATQTRAVMENARELLDAAGLSFPHVVSARAFLPDLKDFAEFNRVYREYVGADRPARATVGAALTSAAYNVEVTFVASAAPRQAIEIAAQPSPNLSAAVKAGNSLFVSGLLAEGDALEGRSRRADARHRPEASTRSWRRRAFAQADVRDLLVYVTDEEPATVGDRRSAATAFGSEAGDEPGRASGWPRPARASRSWRTRSGDEAVSGSASRPACWATRSGSTAATSATRS